VITACTFHTPKYEGFPTKYVLASSSSDVSNVSTSHWCTTVSLQFHDRTTLGTAVSSRLSITLMRLCASPPLLLHILMQQITLRASSPTADSFCMPTLHF
jgi:hypothetical protein